MNEHYHICRNGHLWKHGYNCRKDERAHTCRRCGLVQWRRATPEEVEQARRLAANKGWEVPD